MYRPHTPITARMRDEAMAWLREHDPWIRPASRSGIQDWLIALGLQCASQMPSDEARMRAAAYVSTLSVRPGYWFTMATLRAAAERFKWFPSVAELVKFLEAATSDRSAQVAGARRIVDGPSEESERIFRPEPIGERLAAIADSYARHFGAGDPRAIRARQACDNHEGA